MKKTKRKAAKQTRPERKGKALSIWIEPGLKAKIRRIAKLEGRSASSVVRRSIEVYVDRPPTTGAPIAAEPVPEATAATA